MDQDTKLLGCTWAIKYSVQPRYTLSQSLMMATEPVPGGFCVHFIIYMADHLRILDCI